MIEAAPHLLADYDQQDSQEFLRFLLDGLSQDLCRKKVKNFNDGFNNCVASENLSLPRESTNEATAVMKTSGKSAQKLRNTAQSARNTELEIETGTILHDSMPNILQNSIISSRQSSITSESFESRIPVETACISKNQNFPSPPKSPRPTQLNGSIHTFSSRTSSPGISRILTLSSNDHLTETETETETQPEVQAGQLAAHEERETQLASIETNENINCEDAKVSGDSLSPTWKTCHTDPRELAEKSWSEFIEENDSIVSDLFAGQLQSTIECLTCAQRSHCFDPFYDLSVPIPKESSSTKKNNAMFSISSWRKSAEKIPEVVKCSLRECIEKFTEQETLDGVSYY